MKITDADIDDLLYRRLLTPEGAAELRKKLADDVAPDLPASPRPSQFDLAQLTKLWGQQTERRAVQECAFEAFRRAGHTGPLGLVCTCPRCRTYSLSAVH